MRRIPLAAARPRLEVHASVSTFRHLSDSIVYKTLDEKPVYTLYTTTVLRFTELLLLLLSALSKRYGA